MEAYYDVKEPGSYGGIDALYRLMKQRGENVTRKQVVDWLAEQETYGLHKPVRRRFTRRKIYSRGIDYLWQADLVDMSHLVEENDGHRYLLTVIDVFSKHAWVKKLKKKDSKSITEAFDEIFATRKPFKLQTDKGKEFLNATFQRRLAELQIQFYVSQNDDIKASVVERFNRTFKTKMWKYFTHKSTARYVDVLDDLLHSYNRTRHRTIGCTPIEVTKENESTIRERMYGKEVTSKSSAKFKVGDKVRISKTRRAFDKGYLPNWTEEVFTITDAIDTKPRTYKLEDYGHEKIEGSFYEKEIQRVVKTDNIFKIEKILSTRKRKGVKEYFVKWKGYPEKFNSWIGESDLTTSI